MRLRLLILAFFIVSSAPLMAQVNSAAVTGTVTDESKGVVPGTTSTVTDLETGRKFGADSDARGVYQLPPLPPGFYKLEAEPSGFATHERPRFAPRRAQQAA